jgi:hypothetical protein
MGVPDPFFYHLYQNDFDVFAAGDWTITKVGTGTTALAAADGGALLLTTTGGASDSVLMQLVAASFAMIPATASVAGKKAFFQIRVRLDSATLGTFHAGLIATTTTPLAATDGIYFRKATGAATVLLRNSASSVDTDLALPGGTFVAATDMDLAFFFDGKGTIYAFVNQAPGFTPQNGPPSGSRGAVAALTPAAITASVLNLSFGFTNGSAVARTEQVDFVLAARER